MRLSGFRWVPDPSWVNAPKAVALKTHDYADHCIHSVWRSIRASFGEGGEESKVITMFRKWFLTVFGAQMFLCTHLYGNL